MGVLQVRREEAGGAKLGAPAAPTSLSDYENWGLWEFGETVDDEAFWEFRSFYLTSCVSHFAYTYKMHTLYL